MRACFLACFSACLVLRGCANLPAIPAGTCGNGVVEPLEDCDTFAPDATSTCIPKGSPGECHLDCRRRQDGSAPSCPASWGCDVQGVCRAPTGEFAAPREIDVGGVQSLMSGDFDGDGRADIISREPVDIRGGSKVRFHYFDQNGALADTRSFPKLAALPVVVDVTQDGRSDLLFSDSQFRVALLPGEADRRLVPATAGSYHFPGPHVRLVSVYDGTIQRAFPVMGLGTLAGESGLYGPDENGLLRRRGELPGPVENLAGEPLEGQVVEDPDTSPCWELIIALRDAASFIVVDACTRDPLTGEVQWRDEAAEATVALDPPAPIDAAPVLADMNGDGHLDVLIGAGHRVYIASGDGTGLQTAVPFRLALSNPTEVSPDIPMPLAAGDFTGDHVVDFVFPDSLLISRPVPGGGLPQYMGVHANEGAPWTLAQIVDLNGNGKLDVVAASSARLGIDFFNGTDSPNLFEFTLPTRGPVGHMAVADMDGDLVNDLAYDETTTSELLIAFGNLTGPPGPAATVARIKNIEQLRHFTDTGLGNLSVAYRETVDGAERGVLALLTGSGDRLPFASYELVDLSQGNLFRSAALAVTIGRFTSATSPGDVVTLSTDGNPDLHDYSFWLLPALGFTPATAVRLGGRIDLRLTPAVNDGIHIGVSLAATAADLDGDGRDESLWAIPADGGRCGLVVANLMPGTPPTVFVHDPVFLEAPCPGAQIAAVDPDGDGRLDVAILTGGPGATDRQLLVLWNDGAGGIASAGATTVNAGGESPQQFAVLPAIPVRPLSFVYVTGQAVSIASATPGSRGFAAPRPIASLAAGGSGIAAADVNGDGIPDLVAAAAGNLHILLAQTKP